MLPTPTKVETHIGTDNKNTESKIYFPNSYDSVIVIILYLKSNTRPYISFAVHQCDWFTNNIKVSYETVVIRIY